MILFLDACILIYWMETAEPFYSSLTGKLRNFYQEEPKAEIAVSRLSQLEYLVKPLQANDQALLNNYRTYFASPGLRIVELNSSVRNMRLFMISTWFRVWVKINQVHRTNKRLYYGSSTKCIRGHKSRS